MPSPLRERRGGWRRGILMDVGCMGDGVRRELLWDNSIKIISLRLRASVTKNSICFPSPPSSAVTPAGKKRKTEARYFDGYWLQGGCRAPVIYITKLDKNYFPHPRLRIKRISHAINLRSSAVCFHSKL
jgi:hypothetical protein